MSFLTSGNDASIYERVFILFGFLMPDFLTCCSIDLCKHGLDTEMTTTALKVNAYTSETRAPTTITLSLFDGPVH